MGFGMSILYSKVKEESCMPLTTIANENNYTLKHFLVMDIAFKERPVQLLT